MSRDEDNSRETPPPASDQPLREVPVAWEALEDAFENNAPEVHSYLQLDTGEVIRIVDGIADPAMHTRVMNDSAYLRVEPVSSREQYRWMERFIATVEESEFRDKLVQAIDGKGAFRRFKDVLMSYPVDRERWFAFRSERLRACMEAWLTAHSIKSVPRQQWRVPTADEVRPAVEEADKPARRNRAALAEAHRRRLHELADQLPARELDAAVAFLEFLRERKHLPRPGVAGGAKTADGGDGEAGLETSSSETALGDDGGSLAEGELSERPRPEAGSGGGGSGDGGSGGGGSSDGGSSDGGSGDAVQTKPAR